MANFVVSPQLAFYIREARKAGLTDAAIKENLIAAGWSASHVRAAFYYVRPVKVVPARIRSKVTTEGTKRTSRSYATYGILLGVVVVLSVAVAGISYSQFIVKGKSIFNKSLPLSFAHHAVTHIAAAERPVEVSAEYVDSGTVELGYGDVRFGVDATTASITGTLLAQGAAYEFEGILEKIQRNHNTKKRIAIRGQGAHIFANLDIENEDRENPWVHVTTAVPVSLPEGGMFTDVVYTGMRKSARGERELVFTGTLNKSVFAPILSVVSTNPLFIGKLEFPKSVLEEVVANWDKVSDSKANFSVGLRDRQLHTLDFEITAPSLSHIISQAAGTVAESQLESVATLGQAESIKQALEAYAKEHGGYPVKADLLIPKYIAAWPSSGESNEACGPLYKNFTYTPEGAGVRKRGLQVHPLYNVTFCLKHDTPTAKAGVAILTPVNLLTTVKCPGKEIVCFVPSLSVITEQNIPELYGARLKVRMDFDTSPVQKLVRLPENYVDIIDILPSSQDTE